MATQLKLRRGTTTQHSTFTGASGEVTVDTDKKTLVVHDGATAGGVPLAKEGSTLSNTAGAVGTTNLADSAVTSAKLADASVTSAKIADGAIATADLADGAVTSAKLDTGAAAANLGSYVRTFNGNTGDVTYSAPVTSVNGLTGDVTVSAGAPTTAQVLSATAGATHGAVGTYALLYSTGTNKTAGTNLSSGLSFASAGGATSGTASGTWKVMGFVNTGGSYHNVTVFLRVA